MSQISPPLAGEVKPRRLGYLDAMRGFAILLVVFLHVSHFSFFAEDGVFSDLALIISMPIFFFLSGFVAYKADAQWTSRVAWGQIGRKFIYLIVPFCAFLLIKNYLMQMPLLESLAQPTKNGYWFLPVLFYMFLIYYLVLWVTQPQTFSKMRYTILILAAVVALPVGFAMGSSDESYFSGSLLCRYLQYFVFGIMARKYENIFYKLIGNVGMTIMIVLFVGVLLVLKDTFVGLSLGGIIKQNGFIIAGAQYLILPYLGLLISFGCFYKYRAAFENGGVMGRALQISGRHTLEIYLIHYFLIPALPFVGIWLSTYSNDMIYIISTLLMSVVIMVCSLFIGKIVCTSDTLAYLLFGRKTI